MHGLTTLKKITFAVLVIVSAFTLSSCSTTPAHKATCEDLSQHTSRQGTALAWPVGETKYLGFGVFSCDAASTVKIEIQPDATNAYEFENLALALGEKQTEFSLFDSNIENSKEYFESVKVIAKTAKFKLGRNEKVQIFVGTKPTNEALIYGVERHRIKVTFFDSAGTPIESFTSTNDIGKLAEPKLY